LSASLALWNLSRNILDALGKNTPSPHPTTQSSPRQPAPLISLLPARNDLTYSQNDPPLARNDLISHNNDRTNDNNDRTNDNNDRTSDNNDLARSRFIQLRQFNDRDKDYLKRDRHPLNLA
jgi:hypothetical protein